MLSVSPFYALCCYRLLPAHPPGPAKKCTLERQHQRNEKRKHFKYNIQVETRSHTDTWNGFWSRNAHSKNSRICGGTHRRPTFYPKFSFPFAVFFSRKLRSFRTICNCWMSHFTFCLVLFCVPSIRRRLEDVCGWRSGCCCWMLLLGQLGRCAMMRVF